MLKKKGMIVVLAGWLFLLFGGLLNMSCMSAYYYDHGHRVWRDGHDDDWHKQRGDHWDEERHHDEGH